MNFVMLQRNFSISFPHFLTKNCGLFFSILFDFDSSKKLYSLTKNMFSESIGYMGRVQSSANSVFQANNFDMGSMRFSGGFCISWRILPNDKPKQPHPLELLEPIKSTRSCFAYLSDFYWSVNDAQCEIRRRNWYFWCANRVSCSEGYSFCKYIV